jgi:hemoglobin
MLRRRHRPARIGTDEAEGWLLCFHQAWAETVKDPELGAVVLPKIDALAGHMRNS